VEEPEGIPVRGGDGAQVNRVTIAQEDVRLPARRVGVGPRLGHGAIVVGDARRSDRQGSVPAMRG